MQSVNWDVNIQYDWHSGVNKYDNSKQFLAMAAENQLGYCIPSIIFNFAFEELYFCDRFMWIYLALVDICALTDL